MFFEKTDFNERGMGMVNHPPVKIFSTTGTRALAGKIYDNLKIKLPNATLGKVDAVWFANQNPQLQINDVRDCLAVVIHTQWHDRAFCSIGCHF
jgi:hypothetical protein